MRRGTKRMRLPWYHGWNVLAVAMVFQAVTFGIGLYCFTFWVVPWTRDFAVGRGDVMTVFFAMQVVMGFAAPFAGRAVDGRSIRLLVVAGNITDEELSLAVRIDRPALGLDPAADIRRKLSSGVQARWDDGVLALDMPARSFALVWVE